MGSEQHYSLRWNDYTVKIVTAFQSLRDEEDFVDVTVACDGHSYLAHKMVLSACSPYFRALLRANPCQHPIVILKDVGHVELERLLEFMYNGEVSIAQDQLAAFLRTAENLKIRGLAGSSDDMDQLGLQRPDVSYSYSSCAMGGGGIGGGTSGRSSPSAGYAPSQGSKDEEVGGDGSGGYHTRAESPPSKRRKRPSAPAAGHADSNTATHTSEGGVVGEASVEIDSGGSVSGAMPGEDDVRLDRRELKSEPALPGPSGAAGNQDTIGSHESGGTSLLSSLGRPTQVILSPTLESPVPACEISPLLPATSGPPLKICSLIPAIEKTSTQMPQNSRTVQETSLMASENGSRKRSCTLSGNYDRGKCHENTAVGSNFPLAVSDMVAVEEVLHPNKSFEESLRNLPLDLVVTTMQPQAVTYSIVEESSQRKRNKLIDSLGYSYTFKRKSSAVVHWRCTVRNKNASCKVTIRQRGSTFESSGTHCHPPVAGEALVSQVSALVEKKAAEGVM